MKKHLLIFTFCILTSLFFILNSASLQAQNPETKRTWHWYFGNGAGIDFSSGNPVIDNNSAMDAWESSAVISDTAGNLLFYTDGDTIWNKNHQPMANGIGLFGCGIDTTGGNYQNNSSTQGALIVPKPNANDSIFYVFTTDCIENSGLNGLRYSEINMKLNGGLGVVTNKNILLHAPITEKLTATFHSNSNDIWVLTHEDSTTHFLAYLVSGSGVNPLPVVSDIGTLIMTSHNTMAGAVGGAEGWLRVSYDGKRIVAAYMSTLTTASLEMFDFNNSTGELSNNRVLLSDTSAIGVCFSPDNSKLYVHTLGNLSSSKISQFDLCAGSVANIIASRKFLDLNSWGVMQLGPDGKIYIVRSWLDTLGVINNPNEIYPVCNYVPQGFFLGGRNSEEGICNFVESYLNLMPSNECLVSVDENNSNNEINIYPNPASDILTVNINIPEKATIQIYNSTGSLVEEKITDKINAYNISLINFSQGIYVVKVFSKTYTNSKKLLIIH